MTSILNTFKSLVLGVLVLSFFVAVTVSSCTPKKSGSENTENVEATSESEEHPTDSEEHPTDSEEHPSDSTKAEHPEEEK